MNRRIPLPKITECVHNHAPDRGISRTRLLRACYPFAVVAALSLAHVHIQFAKTDLLMQAGALQQQERGLQRQLAIVERQTQAIDFELLKYQGKRLMDMQEMGNPTKDLLATVPVELQRKYKQPLEMDADDVLVASIREERSQPEGTMKTALLSLVESGRAVASVRPAR